MEKINWTEYVKHTDVLQGVKGEENVLHIIKRRKVNSIGHMLRGNCGLKRVTEGEIERRA